MISETASTAKDDPCSQALSYMDCTSVNRDMKKACSILDGQSADGIPEAQYLYGLFLYTGTAVVQDKASAKDLFSLSASAGNNDAALLIREFDKNGDGETMDLLTALKLEGEQRDSDACSKLFDIYDNGKAPVKKDHKVAVRWYTICAEQDDVSAQNTIGFMYMMGKGVTKDRDLALYWLKKAAESGSSEAMYHIGDMYENSQCFMEQDMKEAVRWYTMSADAGDSDAMYSLAGIHMMEKTKYFSLSKSAKYLESAAELGHGEAQHQIGMMYAYGAQGVKRDVEKAMHYLQASCEAGVQQAMVDYANMRFEGEVLPKDVDVAAKWFEKAANSCNGYAQYALACMYGNGYHFEQSDEMAAKWFREAAEMGEVNSQYCLGCFCYEGRGMEKDPREAAVWFGQAADQGHPGAKAFLGMFTVTGTGVEKDVGAGMKLLLESAEAGYYEAQFYLGKLYMDGDVIERNIPRAKKYLGLAAKQGDRDAVALLNKIKTEKMR